MRKLWVLLLLVIGAVPLLAQTNPVSGYCDLGGKFAAVSGLNSTNYLQGDIPGCTISVYLHGTMTLATIYADDNNTPLSNPFTAVVSTSPNAGFYIFWAATGQGYDVVASGGTAPNTYPSPQTIKEVYLGGGGSGGGCAVSGLPLYAIVSNSPVGTCYGDAHLEYNTASYAEPYVVQSGSGITVGSVANYDENYGYASTALTGDNNTAVGDASTAINSGGGGGPGTGVITLLTPQCTGTNSACFCNGSTTCTTSGLDTTGATLITATVSNINPWSPGPPTVSDSSGNIWNCVTTNTTGGAGDCGWGTTNNAYVEIWYTYAPVTSPTDTFTCATFLCSMFVQVFSGTETTSGVYDTGNGQYCGGTATTCQPVSITPSLPNELLITGLSSQDTIANPSINDSFTLLGFQPSHSDAAGANAYLVDPASSAINPTWTVTSGPQRLAAGIAAFKPGGPGFNGSVAVGYLASANNQSIAIGSQTNAHGAASTVVGSSLASDVGNADVTILGSGVRATAPHQASIGTPTTTDLWLGGPLGPPITIHNCANCSGGSGSPGGTNGQIQYNNLGVFGGITPTGTGLAVLQTNPTLIGPALGTPVSGNLANTTGYPQATSGTFGIVEPDNSTITIFGGVLSAVSAGVTSVQFKNAGTNYGSPLTGVGSLNFVNCTVSGTSPNFTITCTGSGGGTIPDTTAILQGDNHGNALATSGTDTGVEVSWPTEDSHFGVDTGAHGVASVSDGSYTCYQSAGVLCNFGFEGLAAATAPSGGTNLKLNVTTALAVHNSSGGADLGPDGFIWISSAAGTNTYTGTIGLITAYETNATYCMIVPHSNTSGTVTWNLNGIGAEPFKNHAGGSPSTSPAELLINFPTCATWDGTNFDNVTTITGSGDTITSPNSTLAIGGTSIATTLDLEGAAGKIMGGATPALTYTPVLGVDNSSAGTLQTANGSANAHTIWGSAATTSNTILGPATAPTSTDLLSCTTSSTTCTLTDSGVKQTSGIIANASLPKGALHSTFPTLAATTPFVDGAQLAGTFPANFTGTTVYCGTDPAGNITFTLVDVTASATIGTIIVSSSCTTTLATTGGTTQAFSANDRFTLTPGATDASAVNINFIVPYTRN
jgi:hypothetical protein